jgi:hypothetical protein
MSFLLVETGSAFRSNSSQGLLASEKRLKLILHQGFGHDPPQRVKGLLATRGVH